MAKYRPVDPKVNLPRMEEEILEFWGRARIFEKSLGLRKDAPEWVFYEGPPTANGPPGIHHVEARTFKDVYPRYKTMTGHFVFRKAGWDCHGLPVELEVEKELGFKTKRDIEAYGVDRFNAKCRESVQRYVREWGRTTERIGFWIDLDQAYWTMDPGYMQSVWWALKELHARGLLFQDNKVTAYCPRCGTPLSDHEVALGYAQVRDPSVYVKFPVVDASRTAQPEVLRGASLLVWTTTPWTLISNLGVAVSPEEEYVIAVLDGEHVVVAGALVESVLGPDVKTGQSFSGRTLVDARYEPPFPNAGGDTHRVVAADFVSTEEGTGLVHMAPAFGAEDLEVGRREGWPVFSPVDEEGRFTDLAPELVRGKSVKEADPHIVEDLRARGLLLRAEEIEHTYPLCWRCDTPLIYYARPAWYIRTTAFIRELLAANEGVNWYPEHIKHGRYGDWLRNNVDWSLSRERYWGTPLPIWVCSNGHETAVGSLTELSELAGRDVTGTDPHKPYIDEITFGCPRCGEHATRVPYLIDVWFDAGAMPYAQWRYRGPGSEAEETFRRRFPADFIAEGLDQTRGWFYTLMAEGVLLFGESAYRNVVCLGLLLGEDGRRMSTRLGTALDPWTVLDRHGADALRWYFVAGGSPWAARRMSLAAVEDVVRRFLLTLRNTHAFFVTYANLDQPDLTAAPPPSERAPLDRWALSQLHGTVAVVREAMEAYDATRAAKRIEQFVDDLSNWYVRRSRRRFWDPARAGAESAAGKLAAYATLHECLATVSQLVAPFSPFIAEALYRGLVAEVDPSAPESVHLTDFPLAHASLIDHDLDEAMAVARAAVSLGRQVRTGAKVRIRQPLARADLHVPGEHERLRPLLSLVAEELNVKEVRYAESAEELSGWRAKPDFRVLGPRLGPRVQEVARALAEDDGSLAAALAAGREVPVETSAGAEPLTASEVELVQQARTGWGVASDGRVTVALDLEPGEELRLEGAVREVVHHAQNLRKAAGLEVADRILLGVDAGPWVTAAVERYRDQLAAEVLAVEVRTGAVEEPAGSSEASVEGEHIRLSLRPA